MKPLLEADRVAYRYAEGPVVVHDVTLSLAPASMLALIGANGSGKSTLIRMLAGLLRPVSGRVLLDGVALGNWEPRLRAREIAYVPQSMPGAFPFRVLEVVLSGRTPYVPHFHLENAQDAEIAVAALDSVGASHLRDRPVTALSGGERQLVFLARALAQQPRVLLLDEPSNSLDLKHRADLMRTLSRLRDERGVSIVMITHDLQLAGSLFDRIVALRCGDLVAEGTPEEVLQSRVLAEVYGEPNVRAERVGGQTLVWIAT